jgi:hypothetical protein
MLSSSLLSFQHIIKSVYDNSFRKKSSLKCSIKWLYVMSEYEWECLYTEQTRKQWERKIHFIPPAVITYAKFGSQKYVDSSAFFQFRFNFSFFPSFSHSVSLYFRPLSIFTSQIIDYRNLFLLPIIQFSFFLSLISNCSSLIPFNWL